MTTLTTELFWPILFVAGMVALAWLQLKPFMGRRKKRNKLSTRVVDGRIVQVYDVWQ